MPFSSCSPALPCIFLLIAAQGVCNANAQQPEASATDDYAATAYEYMYSSYGRSNLTADFPHLLPHLGQPLPPIGSNSAGASVFANYQNLRTHRQGFFLRTGCSVYESPAHPNECGSVLYWFGDLTFGVNNSSSRSSTTTTVGYAGHAINFFLDEEAFRSGSSIPLDEVGKRPDAISAVFVLQSNVFVGSILATYDNWILRFWDDGSANATQMVGGETADVGDGVSSVFALVATCQWIAVERAADILGVEPDYLTPESFADMYEEVWAEYNQEPAEGGVTSGVDALGRDGNIWKIPIALQLLVFLLRI